LIESVSTLIWVAPRLLADIQELSVVEKQLENKFGKEFALQARSNMTRTVNQKVIHRLGVESPKKSLVENYMIEIARNYKVEYTPDTSALLDDDFLPDTCPSGDDKPFFPTGGGMGGGDTHYDHYMPDPVHYPPQQAGPLPSKMPPMQPAPPYTETAVPYPTGNSHMPEPHLPQLPIVPPPSNGLDLPPVPNTTFPGGSSTASDVGGDVDFDDLTRRFEELKNRK
jgi:vacuolar protein sorting-associated protein IST1